MIFIQMYGGPWQFVRCFGLPILELLQRVCSEFGSEKMCPNLELEMAVAVGFARPRV